MIKEQYISTELEIITFQTDDVITTSKLIEVDPKQSGGGELVDP